MRQFVFDKPGDVPEGAKNLKHKFTPAQGVFAPKPLRLDYVFTAWLLVIMALAVTLIAYASTRLTVLYWLTLTLVVVQALLLVTVLCVTVALHAVLAYGATFVMLYDRTLVPVWHALRKNTSATFRDVELSYAKNSAWDNTLGSYNVNQEMKGDNDIPLFAPKNSAGLSVTYLEQDKHAAVIRSLIETFELEYTIVNMTDNRDYGAPMTETYALRMQSACIVCRDLPSMTHASNVYLVVRGE